MIPDFASCRIVVVGDIMLDRYIYGHSDRISPEAPVPVLKVEREEARIGGAGTVIRNIASLGGGSVLVSAIGGDASGNEITRLVGQLPNTDAYLITENGRTTTVKTRHLAGHHQIARVDSEDTGPLTIETRTQIIAAAESEIAECDVVVISDYAKGAVCCEVARRIIGEAVKRHKPVVVDAKSNILSCMAGATVFTPNLNELSEAIENGRLKTRDSVIQAAKRVIQERSICNVLATRGRDGMILQTKRGETYDYAATATGVVDVTGAGDTVVAVLALALATGMALPEAAAMANAAAGLVVGKIGSATINRQELEAADSFSAPGISA